MHMNRRILPLTEKLPEIIKSFNFVSHRAGMSGEFVSRKDSHSKTSKSDSYLPKIIALFASLKAL